MIRRRELAAVLAAAALTALWTCARAFHMDEPQFLAAARRILSNPLHPLAFAYNWYGCEAPARRVLSHSTLVSYWLAAALRLGGGGEAATRLLCAPLDLAAAWALYRIAASRLDRPLAATLAVLASPAWFLTVPLALADKWLLASALWGLALLCAPWRRRTLPAAAALLGLSIALKHTAVFALAPAFVLARGKRGTRAAAAFCAACLVVPALDALLEPGRLAVSFTWNVAARAAESGWAARMHRVRSLLAFTGGCAAFSLLPALGKVRKRHLFCLLALVPFLPAFDAGPVLLQDRLLGGVLALLAAASLPALAEDPVLAAWAAGGAFLSWLNYAVSARSVLLFTPALILANARRAPKLAASGAAAALALSLALSAVDAGFANGERAAVAAMSEAGLFAGRKVWFAGHWGLQEYMERAGAKALDACRGGWGAAAPGDAVIVPVVNADMVRPAAPVLASSSEMEVDSIIPLRLMSFERSQAGFYSDRRGFLPFALSREPLDRLSAVLLLPPAGKPQAGLRR